jgi:hypothetical protein
MKTLKLLLLPITLAGSMLTIPATASAEPNPGCLIIAGCFWDGSGWACADPAVYMDCVE